jgi:hypothetical protein
MFAVDLTTLVMAHSVDVPQVVCKCVAEVERRGLRLEGIYRIPGYHDEIESLRLAFDTKGDADLSAVEDINSVAGLLKLYFRLLPIPLVTYSAYRSLMDVLMRPPPPPHSYPQHHQSTQGPVSATGSQLPDYLHQHHQHQNPHHHHHHHYQPQQQQQPQLQINPLSHSTTPATIVREMSRVVQELPQAHYATLKYLVGHLAKVVAHESANRMSVENLAKIFVPGILRNPNPVNSIALASHEQYIVQFFILRQSDVFSR